MIARCVFGSLVAVLCIAGATAAADPAAGDCRVETLSLNRLSPVFDGNWQGITVASDGRCYFGSSTHSPSRGAGFFRYDPETDELKVLADDLTVVTGYDPAETVPQGKVHSPIVEADGGYVYRIDIETGEMTNLGRVGKRGRQACFWMFVDHRGDCWFSIWRDGGHLYRIPAESGRIVEYSDVLPEPLQAFDGTPVPAPRAALRSWTWLTPLPGRERALFTMGLSGGNDERLWIFDPERPLETGEAFKPIGYIGSTFLSVALGGDRVYFVQYRHLQDARRWMPELLRDRPLEQIGFPAELHLRSVPIAPDGPLEITDHGRLVDATGGVPRMIESLAADAEGRVFMVGSWTISDPAKATRQYIWEDQPFWPGAEPGTFKQMDRGEFFGHLNTR